MRVGVDVERGKASSLPAIVSFVLYLVSSGLGDVMLEFEFGGFPAVSYGGGSFYRCHVDNLRNLELFSQEFTVGNFAFVPGSRDTQVLFTEKHLNRARSIIDGWKGLVHVVSLPRKSGRLRFLDLSSHGRVGNFFILLAGSVLGWPVDSLNPRTLERRREDLGAGRLRRVTPVRDIAAFPVPFDSRAEAYRYGAGNNLSPRRVSVLRY